MGEVDFFAPVVVPVVLLALFVLEALAAVFVLLVLAAAVPEAEAVLVPVAAGFAGCCLTGVVLAGAWPAVLEEAGVALGFAALVAVAPAVLVVGALVWAPDLGAVVLLAALGAFLFAPDPVVAGAVVQVAGFAAVAVVAVLRVLPVLPEVIFVLVVVGVALAGEVASDLPALPVGMEIRTR